MLPVRLRHLTGSWTGGRGQSTLEFALVLPVFLLLVAGILDFGRGVASHALVSNAAREGARAGIFAQTTDADIVAAANSQALFLGNIPSGSITISPAYPRSSGDTVSVTVVYLFRPATHAMVGVGPTITMSATSRMLVE